MNDDSTPPTPTQTPRRRGRATAVAGIMATSLATIGAGSASAVTTTRTTPDTVVLRLNRQETYEMRATSTALPIYDRLAASLPDGWSNDLGMLGAKSFSTSRAVVDWVYNSGNCLTFKVKHFDRMPVITGWVPARVLLTVGWDKGPGCA